MYYASVIHVLRLSWFFPDFVLLHFLSFENVCQQSRPFLTLLAKLVSLTLTSNLLCCNAASRLILLVQILIQYKILSKELPSLQVSNHLRLRIA